MSRRPGKRRLQERLNAASDLLRERRPAMAAEAVQAVLALLRRAGWQIDEDRQEAHLALAGAEALLDGREAPA